MPTFGYTLAGLLTASVPPGISIEIREAVAGGRAGGLATLYVDAEKSDTADNPVTSTGGGALPEVYAVPGAYVLVMGPETRTVGVAPDPSEDRAEGQVFADDVPSDAASVTYDNTTSELTATDVQAALDELVVRVAALEAP